MGVSKKETPAERINRLEMENASLREAVLDSRMDELMAKKPYQLKKDELVAVAERVTRLDKEALEKMTAERLRWMLGKMRTEKADQQLLPKGYRRLKKEELKSLYLKNLKKEAPAKSTREDMIYELEQWAAELQDAGLGMSGGESSAGDESEKKKESDYVRGKTCNILPMCPQCRVPMTEKTNRMTHENFYGCVMFPICKKVYPLRTGSMPTGVYLMEKARREQAAEARSSRSSASGRMSDGGESWAGSAQGSQVPASYLIASGSEDEKEESKRDLDAEIRELNRLKQKAKKKESRRR